MIDPLFNNNKPEVTFVINNDYITGSFGLGSIGILGLYATVVFAIGKLVRMIFDNAIQRVIYEEMPNPDEIIELCKGNFQNIILIRKLIY